MLSTTLLSSVLATCVFVYSPGMNGDASEKYWHEMAHCNGWEHPNKLSAFGKAYTPPKKYLKVYPGPLVTIKKSTKEAKKICDGHFGCQWFE